MAPPRSRSKPRPPTKSPPSEVGVVEEALRPLFVGDDLRRLRKQVLRWTQADLGNVLHAHPQTVSRWERDVAVPDAWQLQLIACIEARLRRNQSDLERRAVKARQLLRIGEVGEAMGTLFVSG